MANRKMACVALHTEFSPLSCRKDEGYIPYHSIHSELWQDDLVPVLLSSAVREKAPHIEA